MTPRGAPGAAKDADTVHNTHPGPVSHGQVAAPPLGETTVASGCLPSPACNLPVHRTVNDAALRVSASRVTRSRLRKVEPSHLFRRSGRGSRWRTLFLSESRAPRLAPFGVAGLADDPRGVVSALPTGPSRGRTSSFCLPAVHSQREQHCCRAGAPEHCQPMFGRGFLRSFP